MMSLGSVRSAARTRRSQFESTPNSVTINMLQEANRSYRGSLCRLSLRAAQQPERTCSASVSLHSHQSQSRQSYPRRQDSFQVIATEDPRWAELIWPLYCAIAGRARCLQRTLRVWPKTVLSSRIHTQARVSLTSPKSLKLQLQGR